MLALMLTGHGISLPVVIGIMMLIGIVTKNAILLVDFAIEEIHKGVPRREALIDAGLPLPRVRKELLDIQKPVQAGTSLAGR